ncbi:MAG: response regulator [Deltaproteobacteria bacterium]|nr:response regulator [Deltaproteobacteria bacterium]
MKTVLLIEDEAVLRSATVRGLAKLSDLDVVAVGTVAEAVAELDRRLPDLVVSDIDLPDRLGLEMLGELGRRGGVCPVIFVTAYLKAFRSQIPRHARVTVLEKPLALDQLRSQVKAALGVSEASAPVAPFAVADYLQLACMGRHSVEIEVARGDRVVGRIVVCRGAAWSATDLVGRGEPAFRRMIFDHDGVTCRTLAGEPGPRELQRSWEALLMDAARVMDEAGRTNPRADDIESITEVPGPEGGFALEDEAAEPAADWTEPDRFEMLRDLGVEALLSKDYTAAWAALTEAAALHPDDAIIKANLIRLRALGVHVDEPARDEELS